MRHIIFRTAILGFLIGAFFCATASALAQTVSTNEASGTQTPQYSSTAHLGFAVVDQSTTGFDKVAGSLVFLDITKRLIPGIHFGLRTLAQGGQRDGEFYRMGAGPLTNIEINKDWSMQLAYGMFRETALDADGDKAYHSRGQTFMLGWERRMALAERVDLLWGGFYCHHQGNIEPAAAITTAGKSRYAQATTNRGQTHGLEVALQMSL